MFKVSNIFITWQFYLRRCHLVERPGMKNGYEKQKRKEIKNGKENLRKKKKIKREHKFSKAKDKERSSKKKKKNRKKEGRKKMRCEKEGKLGKKSRRKDVSKEINMAALQREFSEVFHFVASFEKKNCSDFQPRPQLLTLVYVFIPSDL